MKRANNLIALLHIILFLLFNRFSFSQVSQAWVAMYNGPGNSIDESSSIAVDGSGNVYVTGVSNSSVAFYDYATIKYNSSGDSVWVKRYNGPGNGYDYAKSIAVDDSGNVYVTGISTGSGTDYDYATIKYNSTGAEQWVARYSGGVGYSIDEAYSIAVDGSGNVFVTGRSDGGSYATIKYNSTGVQQWVAKYNGPGNSYDAASSMAIDGSGNVFVTGRSDGRGTELDYATIKYNSSGDSVWVKRYNGPGNWNDYANSIAVDDLGNVYVTGNSNGSGTDLDYATIKYNSSGDPIWVKRYNGPGNSYDAAYSIALDDSGNVYVTGSSSGSETGNDYAAIKYNSSGDSVWVKRYNGPGNSVDEAYSMTVDGSGKVYVTGRSYVGGTNYDFATIKYNSTGDLVWVKRFNGSGNLSDGALSIAVDGSGNLYVTGYSTDSETGVDYATIKYTQSTGISQTSSIIPEQFSLSQNYTNPFNPVTNLEFGISDLGVVSLKVYDILGKEIITLVNEKLSPGNYKVEFDGSGLTSGVYFYRLTAGEFTETKRMMLVK